MQRFQPSGDEYEEEPPADLLYYGSVFRDDRYDYDYDDELGSFDDEDWEAEWDRRQVPEFNIYYDGELRRWVCDCALYTARGACLHSYRFRGEEVVHVSKDYL